MYCSRFKVFFSCVLILLSVSDDVLGQTSIPFAYQDIARRNNVPVDIWFAVLQQESCIALVGSSYCLPWLWTLNIDSVGVRYPDRAAAAAALQSAIDQGLNVAIGAGQIYWPAHYDQFDTPLELLDADTNLNYSAGYFRKQYDISGDWWTAVGRYHAPSNEVAAENYRSLVRRRWESRRL